MLRTLIIGLALAASSSAFAGPCRIPVGGSENSVGTTWYEARARAAFNASHEILGRADLLKRHGFCPATVLKTELVSSDCNTAGACRVQYRLWQRFEHPTLAARTLSGTHTWDDSWGPQGRGTFAADGISVNGLGAKIDLSAGASNLLMNAMSAAGIKPENMVMGHTKLFAGRLRCSSPVVPNPVASCRFQAGDQTLPVASAATAKALETILKDLNAYEPPVIGAVRTSAALVTCGRVVVPNADASCSLVVEQN